MTPPLGSRAQRTGYKSPLQFMFSTLEEPLTSLSGWEHWRDTREFSSEGGGGWLSFLRLLSHCEGTSERPASSAMTFKLKTSEVKGTVYD